MTQALPSVADLHSHLVPGVDDGARNVEDALEGIGRMVAAGVGALVTTPHLHASTTLDPEAMGRVMDRMDRGWREISSAVAAEHPELVFERGFEVRMDVPDLAFDDPRIRLGGTSYVLIEWPGMQVPPGTAEVVHHIRSRGLRPLIAHIERYSGRRDRVEQAREWRKGGALLQVNLGSLVGRHGSRARTIAFQLLRDGLVDVLATDFHGRPQYDLYIDPVSERLRKAGADEQLLLLTSTNPHHIIRDEDTEIVPPLPPSGGLLGKVKDLFNVGHLAE